MMGLDKVCQSEYMCAGMADNIQYGNQFVNGGDVVEEVHKEGTFDVFVAFMPAKVAA